MIRTTVSTIRQKLWRWRNGKIVRYNLRTTVPFVTGHLEIFHCAPSSSDWLSSRNFFRRDLLLCKFLLLCYYAIVFGPNFREGQKFSGGKTASGGPLPPCGRKPGDS